MSRKKSCDGCRAMDGYGSRIFCHLGHVVETIPWGRGQGFDVRPIGECPKPRTYHDYDLAMFAAKRGIYSTRNPKEAHHD